MRTLIPLIWLAGSSCVLAEPFTLSSPDFHHDAPLSDSNAFKGYGCQGANRSPALRWNNPPAGTRSFALLVHDPEAPTGGSGWWHWQVVDLPAEQRQLPGNAGSPKGTALPGGTRQLRTDFGTAAWGGPCPPAGDLPHRYQFTLYALSVKKLDLPKGAGPAMAGYLVNKFSIGKATLTGTYANPVAIP